HPGRQGSRKTGGLAARMPGGHGGIFSAWPLGLWIGKPESDLEGNIRQESLWPGTQDGLGRPASPPLASNRKAHLRHFSNPREGPMNRRSTVLALAFALLIALTGLRIAAQTDTAAVDPATKAKVQEKLQHISTELNLTDDQKTQLKPMLQSEVQQLQAVKDDTSLSPDQKE